MEGVSTTGSLSPTPTGVISSTPVSPVPSASSGAAFDSSATSAPVVAEHTPPRRRLVKASSRFEEQGNRAIAKREGGPAGITTGPPGFGLDRSSGPSPPGVAVGAGPPVTPLGVSSSPTGISNVFRERTPVRPIVKGDMQPDYPMSAPYGPTGPSGPVKLGRPPFMSNPGVIGDIRSLGRRTDSMLQRRHEPPPGQKHAPEDLRIQQAKRTCMARAQTMGATGNYRNFDSPFGNYMVPVIPNQFFNKTPPSTSAPSSPSNVSPGIQGR